MSVKGSCHCGATRFEIAAAPEQVTSCTCTLCFKRGALWAYYPPDQVKLETPSTTATYRWRTKTVKHHFCPHCGCSTYSESPDWSKGEPDFDHPRIGINARLLDDIDVAAIPVQVIDGRNGW